MYSPQPLRHPQQHQLKCFPSVNSTDSSQPIDHHSPLSKALQLYLNFKKKLLLAMQTLDPLGILESGIFQQYEQSFGQPNFSYMPTSAPKLKKGNRQKVSDFQTVLRSYEVQGVKFTQLQRRSHSCDSRVGGRQRQFREQQIKNSQFIIWSNSMLQLNNTMEQQKCHSRLSAESSLQGLKLQRLHVQNKELRQQINRLYCQNSQLSKQISQLQSSLKQLHREKSNSRNQSDDHRLQFLLKEKQFQKKLQQAREEIQELRNRLQTAQQSAPNKPQTMMEQTKIVDKSLSLLKDKVENEGRIRRTLQQLWVSQLKSQCNHQIE